MTLAPPTHRPFDVLGLNPPRPPLQAPLPDALNLKQGEHLCLIYEHEAAEQFAALVPFLQQGLESGERVVYVTDDNTIEDVRVALAAADVDVNAALSSGALLLWTREEWRPKDDLDSAEMAQHVREVIAEALTAGYSGIRFGVEMTWTLGPDIDPARLGHWEATINTIFTPDVPARIICQYSRRRLSPETLYAALTTHPVAFLGTETFPNPFHQAPLILGQHVPAAPLKVAPEQVEWMLSQMKWQRQYEAERAQRLIAERELALARSEVTRLTQSNADKEDILGLVSHELRTPITLVHGYARFLQRSPAPTAEAKEAIDEIVAGSLRLTRIVTNLLVLARLDAGQEPEYEPALVSPVLAGVVAEHRKRYPTRELTIHDDTCGTPVLANDVYLEQLIANLIGNAEKYSPLPGPIEIHLAVAGGQCSVRVLDRGIGIADDEAEKLFTPFFRSERASRVSPGLGIGLAVCRRLVEVQRGTVWCKNRPGGGSEFGFSLPVAHELA